MRGASARPSGRIKPSRGRIGASYQGRGRILTIGGIARCGRQVCGQPQGTGAPSCIVPDQHPVAKTARRTSASPGTWGRAPWPGRGVQLVKLDDPAFGAPPRSRSVGAHNAGSACRVGPTAPRTDRPDQGIAGNARRLSLSDRPYEAHSEPAPPFRSAARHGKRNGSSVTGRVEEGRGGIP
jgi:hypothetical protein